MNGDELRRRAQVRALAFLHHPRTHDDDDVRELTAAFIEFVNEVLVGDISDGTYTHWLREEPPIGMRRFAAVACGRTFDLNKRAGRFQAQKDIRFVTCPKCRTIAAMSA